MRCQQPGFVLALDRGQGHQALADRESVASGDTADPCSLEGSLERAAKRWQSQRMAGDAVRILVTCFPDL